MSTYQQQQEQAATLAEAVKTLRNSSDFIHHYYTKIEQAEAQPLQAYESFKTAAQSMIEEVQGLSGPLYTQEGKNAMIQERLKELADEYQEKNVQENKELQKTLETLRQSINDKIAATTYANAAETRLKMQDLEAEVKSQLAFATHQRDVEGIMKELVKRGERDQYAARFASKYAYIFAERAAALADSSDRPHSVRHLKTLADKAEKLAYSENERALMTVLESVKTKDFTTPGASKRLIGMHRDTMIQKYR